MSSVEPPIPPTKEDRVEFLFDLQGRVRNLSLPASAQHSLIPLFEAVSNALHAVEFRFGDNATQAGEIEIEIIRTDANEGFPIIGFMVTDNGVGLTDENMKSFLTSAAFKIAMGGKGVGRLTWLKTFQRCEIKSWFAQDGKPLQRSFTFSLAQDNPISKHAVVNAPANFKLGTQVRLAPYLSPYDAHCPKRAETIAAKIVGHFLNYFAVGKLPRVVLQDTELIDLRAFYSDNQQKSDIDVITVPIDPAAPSEFQLYHVLLKKQLRFLESGGLHWLFQAAMTVSQDKSR